MRALVAVWWGILVGISLGGDDPLGTSGVGAHVIWGLHNILVVAGALRQPCQTGQM